MYHLTIEAVCAADMSLSISCRVCQYISALIAISTVGRFTVSSVRTNRLIAIISVHGTTIMAHDPKVSSSTCANHAADGPFVALFAFVTNAICALGYRSPMSTVCATDLVLDLLIILPW
jgi:hypothetical protein